MQQMETCLKLRRTTSLIAVNLTAYNCNGANRHVVKIYSKNSDVSTHWHSNLDWHGCLTVRIQPAIFFAYVTQKNASTKQKDANWNL